MLHSALRSAWDAQGAADRLLAEARDRQAELAGTLKSLELATYQLETANHKLFVARRLTEEARRAKEQFAANISHELRTPLNVILGFSEMMYVSPEVYGDIQWPTPLRQDVYQIYRSSRHLLAMIDDVLELSRFELSEFNLHREPTAIEPLVNSAVEIVRGLFRDRPIRLEVEVAADLPAVDADRTRIRQVLINLLTNARNHTKAGLVRVSAQPDAGEIVFCVADTGPGIPPDKVNRIFDAFFQVDSGPRRERSGTGLGLAISKHFVEAHGGRIWVESREGVGTSVYFALPMPEVGVPTLYPAETGSREPAWSGGRPCVLVVDPDPAVAGLISRHLGGYDVTRVDDSRELSEALGARQPRIAILNVPPQSDRRGPGQSDARLLDALASSPEWRTPETAATTLIECSLPSRSWIAADLRVAGCLTKPVAAEQIHAAIERIGGVADVLVVDDDRGFAQLIERILAAGSNPMRARVAYDGEEGLAAMRNRPPDLVFLDLAMPVLNGFQVLDAMEKDARLCGIPVILLTVTSYAEDVLREHGCRITVDRPGGVNLRAALRYMRAIADASEPVTPDPGPGAPPADPPG
jgi:signal transduction histidine kinase/CheY-like chemotaxis protein